jgi:hypothetical protein
MDEIHTPNGLYFNIDGEPISLVEWANLFEMLEYRSLNKTTVGELRISTVWLGVDHNQIGDIPLIFETMVFLDASLLDVVYTRRYTTKEQAVAGHAEVVELVRALVNAVPTPPTSPSGDAA